VYDDRTVEFDHEVRRKNDSGKPRYTYSIEKIPPTKILEEDHKSFRSLLGKLIISKDIKREYKPVALTLDVTTKLTLIISENGVADRKIVINDAGFDVTEVV
jgi:hypothetical protein